jgi:hypothetical protein
MGKTIADILRGMGETPPSEMDSGIHEKSGQPIEAASDPCLRWTPRQDHHLIEIASEPPVSSCPPWLDVTKIAASNARDVLAAIERGRDPRSFAQRQADGAKSQAVQKARPSAFKRGWGERSAGQTLRNREAVRLRAQAKRARKKAEAGERATP